MCNMIKVTVSMGSADVTEFTLNRDKTPGYMKVLVDLTMTATNSTSIEDRQKIAELNYGACMGGSRLGYISNDMAVKIEYYTE